MIGKKILHYEITEEIGRGGMGIVYKATDTKLKRTVALKFLPLAVGPEERARFDVEAQSVAHLQHPNICGIHEINEIDGQAFIVMPYLDGTGLKHLTAAGPMEIPEAVEVAIQVAHALQEAHEHEIIHRDIKAANVIITQKGLVKVMDFGLAKRKGSTQITQAGTTLGTVNYMSPEQAGGNPADHRTDIWSLGVLLYEMLAGEMPFRAEFDQAIIYSIINQDPAPVSTVRPDTPAQLAEVLIRAMAKNPDDRYQRIEDMLADLLEVQEDIGVPSSIGGSTAAVTARPTTAGRRKATTANTPGVVTTRMAPGRLALFFGLYAAATAVLVLGLRWSVDHFPISPHLPGFVFAVLVVFLPAVLVLVYFRCGHILARVGVPVYIIAAAAVMFFAFQDKDLGATTETVRITDEAGNTIERELPKGQFRKRFAIFYLDNKTGDPSLDWLSYGISQMLRYDLNQETYTSFGMGFTHSHTEAGYDKPVGSPLSLKREFANSSHLPRFLAGSFDRENDEFVVDVTLYDTGSGRPMTEHRYRGASISALVDTMSVQLRRDLGIPEYHIAENPDLPVAEMFTASLEALEHYVNGVNSIWQNNDYERAVNELDSAVSIDPAFAMAYWLLSNAHTALNRGEQAREAMRQALKHKYRLPENEQFNLMNAYHGQREDSEAMLENARRWAALHPEAAGAHETLADHYERVGDIETAIAERKILFKIDPQRYSELHAIGKLYENLDDDEALRYYQKYADLHPDKYDSYTTIGWFHWRRGDYDRARNYYKKALLVDPNQLFIRSNLARIERATGNFAASLEQGEEALSNARSSSDSSTALWQLTEYYKFRGQAGKGLEYQIAALDKMGQTESLLAVTIMTLFTLDSYVDAGRFDEAIAIARSIEKRADLSFIKPMIAAVYIMIYGANEDRSYLPDVEKYAKRFEQWVNASGRDDLRWAVEFCNSLVEYWRDDHQAALNRLNKALDAVTPVTATEFENKLRILIASAEISSEMENFTGAWEFLDQLFELEPFSPEGHLEAARIYHAQGQTQKAIEHLKKALQVWENADPEHPRAKRARELAEQLRLSS